jgi:hypothetical protein
MYKQIIGQEIPEKVVNDFCNRIFTSRYKHSRFVLIDCRYHYEFEGGHVKGALNIIDPAVVKKLFFIPEWINNIDYIDFLLEYGGSRIDIQEANQIIRKFQTKLMIKKNNSIQSKMNKIGINKGGSQK